MFKARKTTTRLLVAASLTLAALTGTGGTAHAATCTWKYSAGGAASWATLTTAGTSLSEVSFGNGFGDTTTIIGRQGYTDFDGDGLSDALRAVVRSDGLYQYQYSPGSRGGWINLAYDATPLANLRIGDFNGDGRSDLFSVARRSDGLYQWRYSSAGRSSWINLAYDGTPLANLRFGDFNSDGRTGLFIVEGVAAGVIMR